MKLNTTTCDCSGDVNNTTNWAQTALSQIITVILELGSISSKPETLAATLGCIIEESGQLETEPQLNNSSTTSHHNLARYQVREIIYPARILICRVSKVECICLQRRWDGVAYTFEPKTANYNLKHWTAHLQLWGNNINLSSISGAKHRNEKKSKVWASKFQEYFWDRISKSLEEFGQRVFLTWGNRIADQTDKKIEE